MPVALLATLALSMGACYRVHERDVPASEGVASDVGPDVRDGGHDAAPAMCMDISFTDTWSGLGQRARITQTGAHLEGVWLSNSRPPFHGELSGAIDDCTATMTFPDDGTFVAHPTADGCEIDWSNATVWRRDHCP